MQREKQQQKQDREIEVNRDSFDGTTPEISILKEPNIVAQLQTQDPTLSVIFQKLSSNTRDRKRNQDKFELRDNILYINRGKHKCLVVPLSCRKYVLQEYHDMRGHRATKHLLKNISEKLWWPSLAKDCEAYYKSCKFCQLHRKNPQEKPGLLNPTIPTRPFGHISCDFIGKLQLSKNKYEHICIIVDSFTKYVWTKPVRTPDTRTAIDCLKEYILIFGCPDSYVSDCASYFNAFAFQTTLNELDIFQRLFRRVPHCNGQCERSVQSLKNILAQYLLEFGQDWERYLQLVTFLYNINYHDTIKTSPYTAVFGTTPKYLGLLQYIPEQPTTLSDKNERHGELLQKLKADIKRAQALNKEYADKKRRHVSYYTGQKVRVAKEADDKSYPNKKIKWKGPYAVVGKRSDRFYFVLITVRTLTGKKKHIVKEYHVRNMRPYVKRPAHLRIASLLSTHLTDKGPPVSCSQAAMEHYPGNILCAPPQFVLAHCISENLKLGAGLAKTLESKFKIRELIRAQPHHVGTAVPTYSKGRCIYNLVTKQHHCHYPRLEDIERSLQALKSEMLRRGHFYLAIPELACGLDGQHLADICRIIDSVFASSGIQIVMFHL